MAATVLIVEDDHALQGLLREILEDEGFRVIPVASLTSLEQSVLAQADLLITDLLFDFEPVGLDVIRAARQLGRADLPTLICSGAREQIEQHAGEIESLGAHLLLKPFTVDELIGAVDRALSTGAFAPQELPAAHA